MEDLTLALVTLTSFVLLFVAAIFADRAGAEMDHGGIDGQPIPLPVESHLGSSPRPRL